MSATALPVTPKTASSLLQHTCVCMCNILRMYTFTAKFTLNISANIAVARKNCKKTSYKLNVTIILRCSGTSIIPYLITGQQTHTYRNV